ncbi:MAG: cbb3-type cytochrome c oxidase subunit I, partial [Armatimonadota bacterium]|nr:cbb3-type cytochrome c oxidase subunit I [Armatimonadota bacterium]
MAHALPHLDARTVGELSFWRRYIFSQDHKVIGIQYALTSMAMAVLGGVLALFIRLQLGWPGRSWPLLGRLFPGGMPEGQMSQSFYLAAVTMHGTIMIFFVLTTLLTGGFGNFLIPLMIGAR